MFVLHHRNYFLPRVAGELLLFTIAHIPTYVLLFLAIISIIIHFILVYRRRSKRTAQ